MWGMGAARMAGAIAQLIPTDRAELGRLLHQIADRLEGKLPIERREPA